MNHELRIIFKFRVKKFAITAKKGYLCKQNGSLQ